MIEEAKLREFDTRRIRTLLRYDRGYIEDLDRSLRGLYASSIRWARHFRRRAPEVAAYYDRMTWISGEAIATIAGLELGLPRMTPEELLKRAIALKEVELGFLQSLADMLRPTAPDWESWVRDLAERVEKWLKELKAMLLLPLWRLHKSHMWYRSYRARETPQPFAMVSVFVYTRKPEDYREEDFDSALEFLEHDPRAFPTFGLAELSASKAAVRKGYAAPGAYREVQGWERERVDEDELGDYEEDTWRYYVALYRISGTEVRIYREYWGQIEPTPVGWEISAQDKSLPKWRKPIGLGWPEELEL